MLMKVLCHNHESVTILLGSQHTEARGTSQAITNAWEPKFFQIIKRLFRRFSLRSATTSNSSPSCPDVMQSENESIFLFSLKFVSLNC